MALPPVRGLSLCAGVGGIELGLHLAIGERYRPVAHIERDAYAAACLVARMADKALAPAPVWDDLATFDGRPWRGAVDLVSGGFPCQPISAAGQRRGTDDERWLWPQFARIIRDVGPSLVCVENVPPLLRPWRRAGGWNRAPVEEVLGDLADLGFDAEWEVLGADDCGAPHRRKRVFILAYRHGAGRCILGWEPEHDWHAWHDADGCCGEELADAVRSGGSEVARGTLGDEGPDARRATLNSHQPDGCSEALADAWPAERGLFPPGPDDLDGWAEVLAADPGLEPSLRRGLDELPAGVDESDLATRLDQLRCLGNGVVPVAAAAAFLRLAERAGLM